MKNEIEQLKKQVSLLHVVQGRTRLEQRGAEWWGCCPLHQESTPSFSIKKKDGEEVFYCFGCGVGGDVIKFIEEAEKCSTKQAIEKLRILSGNIEWQEGARKVAETFHSVAEKKTKIVVPLERWQLFEKQLAGNRAALAWLQDVRGINDETALGYKLGYCQSVKGQLKEEHEHARNKGWIMFPRIKGNKVVAVKMRSIVEKAFSQWNDMDAKALFNTETINALEPVFVTEGEFDTLILEQAGFRAVSIPNSTTKLMPEDKALLKQAECIYLAGDNDGKVGNAAMRQLQRELGENTYMILWPECKDSNEFFLKKCNGDIALFKQEVERLIEKARSTPIEGFTSLLERLRNTGGTNAAEDPNRLHFPTKELDDMNYNPPGSVVVIYSTYSATGKSVFLNQLLLHEAKRGEIVVSYSPELRDESFLSLVAAQTIGPSRLPVGLNRLGLITQKDYQETANLLDRPTERNTDFTFYVGHSLPESEPAKILDFIEMTIKATGATRFAIDTFHRITPTEGRDTITETESKMVKGIEALGIKYGTIFILIGQSNKEAENLKELRRDEHGVLRGSKELKDVAYGVYLLHRKMKAVKEGQDPDDILELETDVVLKKDRGKGPGKSVVHMIYKKECSKFYLLERNASGYNSGSETKTESKNDAMPFGG